MARVVSYTAAHITSLISNAIKRDQHDGVEPLAAIPPLPASRITSGLLDLLRLPDIPASKVEDFSTAATQILQEQQATDMDIALSSLIENPSLSRESLMVLIETMVSTAIRPQPPIELAYVGRGTTDMIAGGSADPTYPAGAETDCLIVMTGSKPYGSAISATGWTSLAQGTSGILANGNDIGSTRAAAFKRDGDIQPTVAGTTEFFGGASLSPIMATGAYRFSKTAGIWDIVAVPVVDTIETGVTIDASGSAPAGTFKTGDFITYLVAMRSDTSSHASRSITIDGCELDPITFASEATGSGSDGKIYHGYTRVIAGSSTGPVYYGATSADGDAATAVVITRVRAI